MQGCEINISGHISIENNNKILIEIGEVKMSICKKTKKIAESQIKRILLTIALCLFEYDIQMQGNIYYLNGIILEDNIEKIRIFSKEFLIRFSYKKVRRLVSDI